MTHVRRRHGGSAGAAAGAVTRASHGAPSTGMVGGGDLYGSQSDIEPLAMPDIPADIIDGRSHILPGSIPIAAFAAGIIPPRVVTSLPTLPVVTYPQGSIVFLTTDGKLYRNTDGSTWSKAVDGVDIIADSILAGQIAAGAIGTSELSASAVIANVLNVGGTVLIDSSGITITDGALSLEDEFGDNVLTGAGFGVSWVDFIASGFYNGHFEVGTLNNIAATTIVGTASTVADYKASTSMDAPYWIIDAETGAGTMGRVVDSTAVGGYAMQWSGTENGRLFQDIAVVPGQNYAVYISWRYTNSSSGFDRTIETQFRKSDHSAIGSPVATTVSKSTTAAAYITETTPDTAAAPSDARYLRISFRINRTSGSPTVWINAVAAVPHGSGSDHAALTNVTSDQHHPRAHDHSLAAEGDEIHLYSALAADRVLTATVNADTFYRFDARADGHIYWGSGAAAADVSLTRSSAGVLAITDVAGTGSGTLTLWGGSAGSEGGQLNLDGAAAYADWSVDNYQGLFRVFSGANVPLSMTPTGTTITGGLTVSGAVNAQTAFWTNGVLGYLVPAGVIVMWSGTLANIPAGWALCDGGSGTPNLGYRVVIAAYGSSPAPHTYGGVQSLDTASVTHGTHATHASHTQADTGTENITQGLSTTAGASVFVADQGHTHTTPAISAHDAHGAHSAHEIPYYYYLAFIMKL